MTKDFSELQLIDQSFDRLGYPEDFLAEYDLMECLSGHRGWETFIVRRKEDGLSAVAKCYDRSLLELGSAGMLEGPVHPGLPRYLGRFENERFLVVVREYIEGSSLSEYARENQLSRREIVDICLKLSDILIFLHSRPEPVIHRDIKPENVILAFEKGSGSPNVYLIDFDIARSFKPEAESDTLFFGTRGYAPPEQYGFAQTDARADIYSFGVLLRMLLTGSIRPNPNIRLYRPLQRIIDRCTAFAPEKRFKDMQSVKRALLSANPAAQLRRTAGLAAAALLAVALLGFGGFKAYKALTYTPYTPDHIPAYMSDEERIADAVAYMKGKYGTDMFDAADDLARMGDLRKALIELYGLDRDYVYAFNDQMPQESEAFFFPWGWDDAQNMDRDVAVYAAVKAHDPSIAADWSALKDDNGFYPGVRVTLAFAEENGILSGLNRPLDISLGELALILANTDRVFEGLEQVK
jgi:hypothetical protein